MAITPGPHGRVWRIVTRDDNGDRPRGNGILQRPVGDLTLSIEQELFAEDALKVKLRQRYGRQVDGFAVEAHLQRLKEQLLPLFERANRQLLSNIQGLRQGRPGVLPTVAIGRAGQVNVAQQQVNLQQRGSRASPDVAPR